MAGASRETCSSASATSFQKKSRSKLIQIPGTKPSVHTGQLIVSSGVPSLDCTLGETLNNSSHQLTLKFYIELNTSSNIIFTIIKPCWGLKLLPTDSFSKSMHIYVGINFFKYIASNNNNNKSNSTPPPIIF